VRRRHRQQLLFPIDKVSLHSWSPTRTRDRA
jgi:hypothetical protein